MHGVLTGATCQLKHSVAIFKMPFKYFQDDLLVILAGLAKGKLDHVSYCGSRRKTGCLGVESCSLYL